MENNKNFNEFLSSSKYNHMFSYLIVEYKNTTIKVYYTPLKKRIINIDGMTEGLSFKLDDNIEKVFDWIKSNSEVELIKMKNKR